MPGQVTSRSWDVLSFLTDPAIFAPTAKSQKWRRICNPLLQKASCHKQAECPEGHPTQPSQWFPPFHDGRAQQLEALRTTYVRGARGRGLQQPRRMRYRMLKRKSTPLGAVRVGQTTTPGEPSTSQQPEDRAEEPSNKFYNRAPAVLRSQGRKALRSIPDHVSVLNEILEEYRRHQLGPDPTTKLRENVGCQIYRIKKFIAFMAEGKGKLSDFCFLNETAKLHAWVSSLRKSNMTVTTIQHYVMNVGTFFSFIAETPPPSCRLSRNALIGLHREIQSLRKSLKRGIALHRTSVRAEKEVRVIAKSTLLKCRTQAMQAIPELLTLLENNPSQKVQWQFYGHFAALLSSIYGHRGGVFQNITIQEVLAAQKSTSQKAYLINVTSHKTNQAFGPAQIALTEEEYGWEAWKSMGLPGCPTFTDIRTSIASHAKFTHSNKNRLKISKFMCHDVKTADKFYVTNLSAQQAMEHRRLFESALEGPEQSPTKLATPIKRKRSAKKPRASKKPPPASSELTSGSTTPEETEVRYQESGTSSPESIECETEISEEAGQGEVERAGKRG
ncbi:hypothetical protein H4Q32_026407 [Labeo rohita]|uniref:Core-binding (CB) domain-containing protein n=1 Tax=Labeo rohita TaxID=84645 RepID=A0ABQ8LAN1_LABRO|nr:hypothetical protein H4Q32_026407 [Labeo rohita]